MADDNYRTRGLSAWTKSYYNALKDKAPEFLANKDAMQALMDSAAGKNVGSVDWPGPDGFGAPFNPMESTYKRQQEIGQIQASKLMLEDLTGTASAPPASTKLGAPGPMDKGFVGPHGPVPGSGGGRKLGKPGPLDPGYDGPSATAGDKKLGMPGPLDPGYDGPSATAGGKKLGMPGPMDKGFAGPHGPAAASGAVSSAPPPSAPAASAGQKQSFTLAEVQAQVAAAVTQLTQRFCTRSEVEDRIDMKVPPEISGMRNVPDGGVPRKHVGYLQINNMGGEPSTAYWGDGPEGGDGGGLNLSLFDFGYSVTDADRRQITVQDGVFRIGQESRTVAAEVLTVSASPYRVYLSYPRGGTPVIEGSSNLNDTLPGADVFKVLLYTFTLSEDSGAVTLDRIHHLGSVQVGNVWA